MSMAGALGAALSGLRVTSANLELVAQNISNADTPGYSRRLTAQAETANVPGVRLIEAGRAIDAFVSAQLVQESSGMGYAGVMAQYARQLDGIFGQPGGPNALDTQMNELLSSLDRLATSPESPIAREGVVRSAQILANSLNGMSANVQALRTDTERALDAAVGRVNEILQGLEDINGEITTASATGEAPAALLDRRDGLLEELAGYIDIRVQQRGNGVVGVYTSSGALLLDGSAANLSFDARGTLTPQSRYSTNSAERSVGTITMVAANGYPIDLIADNALRSGELKALIDLRDDVLTQAQAQLDAVADSMARALSSRGIDGTAAASGAQTGFEIDLAALQDGDSVTLTYLDATNTEQTVTIVRVDEAGAPPLGDAYTANPNDTVLAIDFSGGVAAAAADIATALGPSLTVSGSGTTLTVLDDGAAGTTDIVALSATVTETSLQSGDVALPMFTDAATGSIYTARHGTVPQSLGFAGRIAVNDALVADPGLLVAYDAGIAAGDQTRPQAILARLQDESWTFQGHTALEGAVNFTGSLSSFINRMIAFQGREAETAERAFETQSIAYDQLRVRRAEASGVDIDQEMAFLVSLQTAYQANAQVIATYRELTQLLMRI